MSSPFQDGQTILFTGDSITACGRCNSEGVSLGSGFVQLFADMLVVREPEKQIHVVNTGTGGNTIDDLRNRWVDDVITHHPDWVVCMIGINDCCRYLTDGDKELAPDRFSTTLSRLLAATRRALPDTRMILMDPFFAGTDNGSLLPGSFNARIQETLPSYIKAVSDAADVFKATYIRTQSIFHAHFQYQHPIVYFPKERVHPNSAGHMLIAEALYGQLCDPDA